MAESVEYSVTSQNAPFSVTGKDSPIIARGDASRQFGL